jgi:hypothetical protein
LAEPFTLFVDAKFNQASLLDSPFSNPFEEESEINMNEYLTAGDTEIRAISGVSTFFFQIRVRLTDTMTIRNRTAYNFITLISEISGFADLLNVSVGFLLALLYTPRMLEAALIKHMRPVDLSP